MFYELFMRYPDFKTKAVTLSYDDGVYQDRPLVETLNRYGLKCTFNLNSAKLGQPGGPKSRIPAEELTTLYAGHEIAVHTLTHPHLDQLTPGQVAYQISQDRKNLEDIVHRPVEGMAYPFGLSEVPGLVETVGNCGIRYARTTVTTEDFSLPADPLRWHPTCHHANPHLPELFARFMTPDDWEHPWRINCKLLYIWGHSYEFDDKWEELEAMCRLISGKENVWYATNGEILDYLESYRRLRPSVDGRFLHNPTATAVYVHVNNKDRVIHPGETIEV